jgi:hypothetical protein
MDSDTIPAVADALRHIPIWSVVAVAGAAVLWSLLQYLDRRHARRVAAERQLAEQAQAARMSAEKNARADKFASALGSIAAALNENTLASTKNATDVQNSLARVERVIADSIDVKHKLIEASDAMSDSVRAMVAASQGAMSADDSRRLIYREMTALRNEVYYAFCASLRRNHYADEPKEVERKIKDGLKVQFHRTRDILKSYALSVEPDYALKVYKSDKGTTRFNLIDRLWEELVPLYLSPADYNNKTAGEAQDKRTEDIVRGLFADAYEAGMEQALAVYTRDPSSGSHYPTVPLEQDTKMRGSSVFKTLR